MNQSEKLQALLALLDDVIKKDEERTSKGKWTTTHESEDNEHWVLDDRESIICEPQFGCDASFIASASVSHGRNARALKILLDRFKVVWNQDDERFLNSIFSLYPDEILKRYLKP